MSRLFLKILPGLFNVYVINIEVDTATLWFNYSLKNEQSYDVCSPLQWDGIKRIIFKPKKF